MELINRFFGFMLDLIFNGASSISPVMALGISIILFTLVARILLTPLQISSQRTSRGMSKIQPQLAKIQSKYKGKTDKQSQMLQTMEMQELYKKYKIRPLAGCLPLVIQLPLIWAMFNVLRTPAQYITKLGNQYTNIANVIIGKVNNYQALLEPFKNTIERTARTGYDLKTAEGLSKYLSHLDSFQWQKFLSQLDPSVQNVVKSGLQLKNNYETFFGMNLVDTPSLLVGHGQYLVLVVPIIAGVSTYIFSKISMSANGNPQATSANGQNTAESMMKTMNIVAPIMTAVFSWTMPIGLALYWIAGNLIMMAQQWVVNKVLNKQDLILEEKIKKEHEASGKPVMVAKKKVLKKVPVQKNVTTSEKSKTQKEDNKK